MKRKTLFMRMGILLLALCVLFTGVGLAADTDPTGQPDGIVQEPAGPQPAGGENTPLVPDNGNESPGDANGTNGENTPLVPEGATTKTITAFDALAEGADKVQGETGTDISGLGLPDTLKATVDGAAAEVPVKAWEAKADTSAYDKDTAGTYLLVPVFGEGYTLDLGTDETGKAILPPEITVTLAAPAKTPVEEPTEPDDTEEPPSKSTAKTIKAFAALDADVQTQTVQPGAKKADLNLPDALAVTIDDGHGGPSVAGATDKVNSDEAGREGALGYGAGATGKDESITGVTWECETYDETTGMTEGEYAWTPVLPEVYALELGMDEAGDALLPPVITAQVGGLMSPMAVISAGTQDNPFMPTDDFTDIKDTIEAAPNGSTLYFGAGEFEFPDEMLTGSQDGKIITLIGAGQGRTNLNSTSTTNRRHFRYDGNITLTLKDMTLNGNNTGTSGGGGVQAVNGTVEMENCTVSGVYIASNGGGVSAKTVTLKNCTVSGNTANYDGFSASGGGVKATNSAILTNCTVSGNTVSRGSYNYGGGVDAGTATLTNCTVTGNTAGTIGGGVNAGTATLTNCTVTGNTAGTGGGVDATNYYVYGSIVAGNTNGDVRVGNTTWQPSQPTAPNYNIIGYDASLPGQTSLADIFGSNTLANNGGPTQTIALAEGSPAIGGVDLSQVSGWTPPKKDQRGFVRDPGGTGFICIGAYEADSVDLVVTNKNDAGTGSLRWCIANSEAGDTITFDPAVDWARNSITLQTALPDIAHDLAIEGPAGGVEIKVGGGFRHFSAGTVTLTLQNLTLTGTNTGTSGGGGVQMTGAGSILNAENCTIQSCYTGDRGGGIRTEGKANITDCKLLNNTAQYDGPDGGGGISAQGDVVLTGCTFTGNTANPLTSDQPRGRGGGVYTNGAATLTNCTFTDNTAHHHGGGIYAGGAASLTGCSIKNNKAGQGGGVYAASTATLENCGFEGNEATGANAANGGGGVYAQSDVELTGCSFTGNTSSYSGGGMTALTNAELTDCQFKGNTADNFMGGGLHLGGNASSGHQSALTRCVFTGNTVNPSQYVGSRGGGMSANCEVTLTDCTFTGNTSTGGSGGGVFAMISPLISMNNCTITGNTASSSGGGVYAATANLTNCTVSGNTATTGEGGGVHATTASNIYGSIVAGNDAASNVDVSGTVASNENNIIGVPAGSSLGNILNVDASGKPLLADNGGSTQTVLINANGPALDGVPASVTWLPDYDQRGISRPQGAAADIGAVEMKYSTLTLTAGTGGSITTGTGGSYAQGQTIPIAATPSSGYDFAGWTVTGGGSFASASSASTTFTMPGGDATVTASFKQLPAVTSVSVSPKTATVTKGQTQRFTARVDAVAGANQDVVWSVNSTVSSIDNTGKLTVASNETKTMLTVTATSRFDSTKSDTATVTVEEAKYQFSGLFPTVTNRANPVSGTVDGPFAEFRRLLVGGNALTESVDFEKTSGSTIITLLPAYLGTLQNGTYDVVAEFASGTAATTLKVDVSVAVTGITADPSVGTNVKVGVGGTAQLKVVITPDNAANKTVTWTSSDTSIATVDSNGLVRGIKAGTTTITATTADGGYTATFTVTVTAGATSPQTEDNANLSLWIALCMAAGAAVLYVIQKRRGKIKAE